MANSNRNIYALMRGLVRSEVERLFMDDNFGTDNPKTPPNERKAGSQRSKKSVKGRVTSPNDKRLKANREL